MGERKLLIFSHWSLKVEIRERYFILVNVYLLFKTLQNVLLGLRWKGQCFRAAIFKSRC